MINAAKINDWLQIIGMFGVMTSLVFVGLQIKQTQEIALSNTYQARAHSSVETNLAITMSPLLVSAEAKLWVGKQDQLSPEEIIALAHDFWGKMDTYENNHYQFESGFLNEEHWRKNLLQLTCIFTNPIYQQMWEPKEYRVSFSELVEDIIQGTVDNPSDCWNCEDGSIWDWG
jgi:hypothetical protein